MAGGIIGALLAAMPGMLDDRALTRPRVKHIARAHRLIHLVVTGLFAVTLGLRTQYPPGTGVLILRSAIGVLLLGISGRLGGALVDLYGTALRKASARRAWWRRPRRVRWM